jgi:hypothetical protein
MWQDETSEVRTAFKKLAEDEKKLHFQLHPNYRYQPRKPSEKKRRMTKKKADAIVSQQGTTATLNGDEASGNFYGNFSEIRNTTLPLSAQAQMCIAEDNHSMLSYGPTIGFDFAPSQEYADAQEADMKLVEEHLGLEFSSEDPSLTNKYHLGEPADGFNFALHACDFPEYEAELTEYLNCGA